MGAGRRGRGQGHLGGKSKMDGDGSVPYDGEIRSGIDLECGTITMRKRTMKFNKLEIVSATLFPFLRYNQRESRI